MPAKSALDVPDVDQSSAQSATFSLSPAKPVHTPTNLVRLAGGPRDYTKTEEGALGTLLDGVLMAAYGGR